MMKKSRDTEAAFRALGDENRLQILQILQSGPRNAGELLEMVSVSQSTLSHHMKTLAEARLVFARKAGKWTYYTLNPQELHALSRQLEEMAAPVSPQGGMQQPAADISEGKISASPKQAVKSADAEKKAQAPAASEKRAEAETQVSVASEKKAEVKEQAPAASEKRAEAETQASAASKKKEKKKDKKKDKQKAEKDASGKKGKKKKHDGKK